MTTIHAFLSIDGGAAEFKPPMPSNGKWDSDDCYIPSDVRPNEPSIFMVTESPGSSASGDSTSTN